MLYTKLVEVFQIVKGMHAASGDAYRSGRGLRKSFQIRQKFCIL
jgi:hypothetical protein